MTSVGRRKRKKRRPEEREEEREGTGEGKNSLVNPFVAGKVTE